MAKIAYSCCGEGQGHSSRTYTIVRALQERGHEVLVFASGKAFEVLSPKLSKVLRIPGLKLIYEKNKVVVHKSIFANINILLARKPAIAEITRNLQTFKPDLAITDFDPYLPWAAKKLGVPFISIDHQHVLPCVDPMVPLNLRLDWIATKKIVTSMHSGEMANLATSFYFPERLSGHGNTEFFPPILRDEVLKRQSVNEGHVLVYQTSPSFQRLPQILKQMPFEFRIYAFEREGRDGNLLYHPRSTTTFLDDLATADWVLTNGGYTCISESLFYRKPVFAVPVERQLEQWVNAYYLEKLGYGMTCSTHELSTDRLKQFIERKESIRKTLQNGSFCGNEAMIDKVTSFLPNAKEAAILPASLR
ncbi:MAG: glycosyltransferase family protein [Verrucomicrobiota bacterium]|nr:glycosyltransferase family protein [Verrucomicrobiota bacterium]